MAEEAEIRAKAEEAAIIAEAEEAISLTPDEKVTDEVATEEVDPNNLVALVPAGKAAPADPKAAQAMKVNDELCPDNEYGENDGKSAFKCSECKLLFIPMTYFHGDGIADYEHCGKHIGVLKCENCAMPLVGLERIRSHRENCHEPA